MQENESTWYRWSAKEGPTMLRHGRAHLVGHQQGFRGYPDGTGRRRDVSLNAEWSTIGAKHGFGFEVKVGTNGSEHQLGLTLYGGPLFAVWLSASGIVPYRWLERRRPDGSVDYDSRITSLRAYIDSLHHPVILWNVWAPRDGYSVAERKWWRERYVSVPRAVFGKSECTTTVLESGTCVVPMPEANYPATWKRTEYVKRYTKPLGRARDRIMGPRTHRLVEVEPGKPIQVPGKGENSWDIDDDHIHSMSATGTVEDVVGRLVASALRTRRRHGGQHMNTPMT